MKNSIRFISASVAILIIVTAVACGKAPVDSQNATVAPGSEITSEVTSAEVTTEPELFADVDYNQRDFRVYTSINTNDATNANALIEGSGEQNGEFVNDAVYARNQFVEELLNVKLKFIQSDLLYNAVAGAIKKVVLAGDDVYDVIINDIYPAGELSLQSMFVNVNNGVHMDYSKPYWYKSYMEDLKAVDDRMYILAGDYFMDIIGSAHTLFYNKDLVSNYYGDPELIYQYVLDGKWTMDQMIEISEKSYSDLNGDGEKDETDNLGYICVGMWGSMIPFVIGSDTKFVERGTDGKLAFGFNNEHSVILLEKLNKLFYSNGTMTNIKDSTVEGIRKVFGSGNTVFLGYNRLGDLEKMRDISFEIGVVPYPKLDETQENYITSSHDTTEIGVVPITIKDIDFVSTLLEVLCRETSKQVIPVYYETALKVKYARDNKSAQMIDIIHDSFGATFPLAYSTSVAGFFLNTTFSAPLAKNSTDFASNYAKLEKSATTKLNELVEKILANPQ